HMSFVEDIDLVFAGGGGHHYFFAQFANAIDTAIGSRIDLNHIERIASGNLTTLLALVARLPVLWVCAVDGLGKEASHRGLAGAARPGEEIGMSQVTTIECVFQSTNDSFLTHKLGEGLGAPFAIKRL